MSTCVDDVRVAGEHRKVTLSCCLIVQQGVSHDLNVHAPVYRVTEHKDSSKVSAGIQGQLFVSCRVSWGARWVNGVVCSVVLSRKQTGSRRA